MARSLPDISQKVVANAQGFINEFQRADNAVRRTAASVNKEVDALSKSLSRKFTLSDVGKDLVKGFGLGSGFAAAETAAQLLVKHFEDAAAAAKMMEESSAKSLEHTLKLVAARQTETQQLETALKRRAELARELAEIQTPKFTTVTRMVGGMSSVAPSALTTSEQSVVDPQKIREATHALEKADEAVRALQDSLKKKDAEEAQKELQRRAKSLSDGLKQQEEAFDALVKKQRDSNEETAKARKAAEELAEKYRDLGDPLRQYRQQLEEIAKLQADGKLIAEDALGAQVKIWGDMADAINRVRTARDAADMKREDDAAFGAAVTELSRIEEATQQFEAHMSSMWQSVSDRGAQAFADLAITGKGAFGDLVDIVARSVVEIAAQLLILNPILNGIFGGMGGFKALPAAFSFGGGKARGGAVEPGFAYMVNENRQEYFRPNVGGEVMAIGPGGGGGSGGGDAFTFNYSFTGGITKSELMPLLVLHQRETLAKIADAKRRRTAAGYAL